VRVLCYFCGKSVTSELPDDSVIRATLICPECLELADQTKLNTVLEDIVNKRKKQMS
jgi:hypothetical protein